jgi:hypothetical protein
VSLFLNHPVVFGVNLLVVLEVLAIGVSEHNDNAIHVTLDIADVVYLLIAIEAVRIASRGSDRVDGKGRRVSRHLFHCVSTFGDGEIVQPCWRGGVQYRPTCSTMDRSCVPTHSRTWRG